MLFDCGHTCLLLARTATLVGSRSAGWPEAFHVPARLHELHYSVCGTLFPPGRNLQWPASPRWGHNREPKDLMDEVVDKADG